MKPANDEFEEDGEPITAIDVEKALAQGKPGRAMSAAVAMLQNKALLQLYADGIHLRPTAAFMEASPLDQAAAAVGHAVKAATEVKDRMEPRQRDRVFAAIDVLKAAHVIHLRLHEGFKADDVDAAANVLGEIFFLGAILGSADERFDGALQGLYQDALERTIQREGRREGQRKNAAVLVQWHEPVREAARALCEAEPTIQSTVLAKRIETQRVAATPSHERLLKFIRDERKAGRIPRLHKG